MGSLVGVGSGNTASKEHLQVKLIAQGKESEEKLPGAATELPAAVVFSRG
jgi:hypothetical protein